MSVLYSQVDVGAAVQSQEGVLALRRRVSEAYATYVTAEVRWEVPALFSQLLADLVQTLAAAGLSAPAGQEESLVASGASGAAASDLAELTMWLVRGDGVGVFGGLNHLLAFGEPASPADAPTGSVWASMSHLAGQLVTGDLAPHAFAEQLLDLLRETCEEALLDGAGRVEGVTLFLNIEVPVDTSPELLSAKLQAVDESLTKALAYLSAVEAGLRRPVALFRKGADLLAAITSLSPIKLIASTKSWLTKSAEDASKIIADLLDSFTVEVAGHVEFTNAEEVAKAAAAAELASSRLLLLAARARSIFKHEGEV